MPVEVEVINVTKRFGDVVAVDNVSFEVMKGEFFSLLGPSGCGKTTTLRIIAGLEEMDGGTVKLAGEVVNDVPAHKRHIGMVFQGLALFPHMSVFDNIAFGLKMYKFPGEEIEGRVNKILDIVEMPAETFAKRGIKQLSGGQQQRVEIARALVIEPKVLLLDEPLGPLDLKIRQRMQLELKRIQSRVGTTFLYVTHDQGEALTMSSKIAVMNNGKIQQIGKPKDIYERPKNKFVASFIGEANFIEGTCRSLETFEGKNVPLIKVEADEELVGKDVFLSIRPEKIRVGRRLQGVDNVFEGKIEETIYQGSLVVMRIKLIDGISLNAQVPMIDKVADFEVGNKVSVGWNKEDAIIIPM